MRIKPTPPQTFTVELSREELEDLELSMGVAMAYLPSKSSRYYKLAVELRRALNTD